MLSVALLSPFKKDKNSFHTKNCFGPKLFLNQHFFDVYSQAIIFKVAKKILDQGKPSKFEHHSTRMDFRGRGVAKPFIKKRYEHPKNFCP